MAFGKKTNAIPPALAKETVAKSIDLHEAVAQAQEKTKVMKSGLPQASIDQDLVDRIAQTFGNNAKLKLPEPVIKMYADAGWTLKWVRFIDPKTKNTDFKSINEYFSMQGAVVTYAELSSLDPMYAMSKQRSHIADLSGMGGEVSDAVTVGGDLILMRYPTVIENARVDKLIATNRRNAARTIEEAQEGGLKAASGRVDTTGMYK